jgi:hypothetical protein
MLLIDADPATYSLVVEEADTPAMVPPVAKT